MSGEYVKGSLYFYAPNKGAPIFFAVAFAASGLYHAYQCIHYNSWRTTGLYVFCSALFATGFIIREVSAYHYTDLGYYIASLCLIFAAPPLLELSNYNILGRLLYYVPHHSPIHPGRVITTFTMISAVVESLNGAGASLTANLSLPEHKQAAGRSLLKASLVIQIVVLLLFASLAGTFHLRCRRAGVTHPNVTGVLRTLYASGVILMARTIFRTVEYFGVADFHLREGVGVEDLSPMLRYEWYFYVFEAALMLVNNVLINVRHPRQYLPKSVKTYLAEDGVTEVTGEGYVDERPFLVTVLDPFGLGKRSSSRKANGKGEVEAVV
ncbi:hypothetical protein B0T18DRAFT_488104 [Schizothecium vesticola]|uniref:RTA1 domain protein n=1 Tax=Schizothecium vesticola TaxID=314040 RepID=A0AA40F3D0_9PEZI|nr:hypothetical protein B0T18DRAFT_488104 [Schizothecium vesticola]